MEAEMRLLFLPALILNGAIFGFFYAWVCSTMWGLDRLAPEVAIAAMQGMNASVRNAVFAPAFFGTGPVLLLTAVLAVQREARQAAGLIAAAGLVYIGGAMLPTMLVNVPMNEALALVDPATSDAAQVWSDYSGHWQAWNIGRTVMSGLALCLTGLGLMRLNHG
jgi:uncharacterized membrane protein